jgi:hypothetical protein
VFGSPLPLDDSRKRAAASDTTKADIGSPPSPDDSGRRANVRWRFRRR